MEHFDWNRSSLPRMLKDHLDSVSPKVCINHLACVGGSIVEEDREQEWRWKAISDHSFGAVLGNPRPSVKLFNNYSVYTWVRCYRKTVLQKCRVRKVYEVGLNWRIYKKVRSEWLVLCRSPMKNRFKSHIYYCDFFSSPKKWKNIQEESFKTSGQMPLPLWSCIEYPDVVNLFLYEASIDFSPIYIGVPST